MALHGSWHCALPWEGALPAESTAFGPDPHQVQRGVEALEPSMTFHDLP